MAYIPARFAQTKSAASSPLFTIANGESAILKSMTFVNSGSSTAVATVSIGTFPVVRVSLNADATAFADMSHVLNAGDSVNLTVTGGTAADSVTTTISGVRITP